jgi:hypothetical protein
MRLPQQLVWDWMLVVSLQPVCNIAPQSAFSQPEIFHAHTAHFLWLLLTQQWQEAAGQKLCFTPVAANTKTV